MNSRRSVGPKRSRVPGPGGQEVLRLGRAGEYEVAGLLGAGGMAEVLHCRRVGAAGVKVDVAIKRTRAELGRHRQLRAMFIAEAKTSAALHHHNIVRIIDFAVVGDDFFLVMELVRGLSLGDALTLSKEKGRRLSAGFACEVAAQVADALYYAHEVARDGESGRPLRVVHRDVKPHNVLLSSSGEVKLADFGIARADLGQGDTGSLGVRRGTPDYMSPEQIRGEPLDGRSDLFALGTCLVQMLTGELPFKGGQTSQGMLEAILSTRPRELEARLQLVSPELRSIALRCLARSPRDRYPSGLELAEDLRGFLHARGIRVGAGELGAELQTLRTLAPLYSDQELHGQEAATRGRESEPWLTGSGR